MRMILRIAFVSLVAIVACPVGVALAEGPLAVTIISPTSGGVTNNPAPVFAGTAQLGEEDGGVKVTLTIQGTSNSGTPVAQTQSALLLPPLGPFPATDTWGVAVEPLPDGTYTALATEEYEAKGQKEHVESKDVTFTVDTTAPKITLTSPANGSSTTSTSQAVSGAAGVEPGDSTSVKIKLFAGSAIGPQPLETLLKEASNGAWSGTFGGLTPGTYTVRAEQSDEAGNVGFSEPVTFTVTTPPPPPEAPAPTASFTWFPSAPKTGEDVSLVSESTDTTSPITGFAWALSKPNVFTAGAPVLTTSFSTPGVHQVQLRVTAANGRSSIATESIYVGSSPLVLMQPFPVVRIAGSETFSGVDLKLLTAQAPAGARITVTCKGHGCPTKSETRVASSSKTKGGAVTVEFRRFERALPAGVVLEIRIFMSGEIGKFTRFTVRHDKLPERDDACLAPSGITPIVCPSS